MEVRVKINGNVENVIKLRIMMHAIAQTMLLADIFLHLECCWLSDDTEFVTFSLFFLIQKNLCLIDQYHCRSKCAILRIICN